jgi:hypothetical protein
LNAFFTDNRIRADLWHFGVSARRTEVDPIANFDFGDSRSHSTALQFSNARPIDQLVQIGPDVVFRALATRWCSCTRR